MKHHVKRLFLLGLVVKNKVSNDEAGKNNEIGNNTVENGEVERNKKEPKGKEKTMEKVLHVEGMMCEKCVAHVKKGLERVEGVEEAIVDLEGKSATVKLTTEVSDEDAD